MNRQEAIEFFSKPFYIGDSVYAHFDGYHIILETRNGLPTDPSNTIALEPPVLAALNRYKDTIYKTFEDIKEKENIKEKKEFPVPLAKKMRIVKNDK